MIKPEQNGEERYYSMSFIDRKSVLLSVRIHAHGVGSNYLSSLKPEDALQAEFQANPVFHFPRKAKAVVMIANGTGIAPFLGMIEKNTRKKNITLYWGGYNALSFSLYKNRLDKFTETGKLQRYCTAYSRVAHKMYVQDVLKAEEQFLIESFRTGAAFMICGSLDMRDSVLAVLEDIFRKEFDGPLSNYRSRGPEYWKIATEAYCKLNNSCNGPVKFDPNFKPIRIRIFMVI